MQKFCRLYIVHYPNCQLEVYVKMFIIIFLLYQGGLTIAQNVAVAGRSV